MSKHNDFAPEEPRIVRVFYGKDNIHIGAVADNDVVGSREDAEQILTNIAEIYGDSLCREAGKIESELNSSPAGI